MQKKLYLGAFLLAAAFGMNAEYVTPEQALQRMSSHTGQKVKGMIQVNKDLLFTYQSENGMPAMYVFGTKGTEGYMLLSADDAVAPLLGYADKGNFDVDNMPPQMKAWLSEYSRQVEYAREHGLPAYKAPAKDSREPVKPLMSTIWNQSEPFNLYTPRIGSVATPTGCVATAMAQVMKYWNYPETAMGTGVITNPATGRSESMQLGAEDFQWDKMLDSYNETYTDEEADAVAYLMKACGYASQMAYNTSVSGTFSLLAAKAMIDNFLYNPNIQYCQRNYYTATQWDDMVYNEVSNGRPILYGAQSTSGGHEFVCDGYSGDGFYHFNWGWGGMSDGYFILDSLNPGAIGIGGGAGGGFNYSQDILAGVQPTEELIYQPTLTQFGELTGSVKNNRLTLKIVRDGMTSQWVNTNVRDVNLAIGVAIESVDGKAETQYILNKSARVAAPDYRRSGDYLSISYSGINGQFSCDFPTDLPDGKYKVVISTKNSNSDTWIPVLTEAEAYNYIYVTKTGDNLEVEDLPTPVVKLDKAELKTELYFGSYATFEITVTNDSEKEMTQGFYPQLFFNGQLNLMGDGVVLTLQPNETLVYEFTTQFRTLSNASAPTSRRTYELRWNDPGSNTYYDLTETVDMYVSNIVPSLDITKFEIVGEESSKSIVPGAGMSQVYQITDIENIEIDLSFTNTKGFFGYPLYLAVFNAASSGSSLMSSIFEPLVPLNEGESCDLSTTINMSVGSLNSTYAGYLFYQGTKGMVQVPNADVLYFKLIGGSGVEEIEDYTNVPAIYYNLQGIKVKNPEKGALLIKRQGDKIEKVVY
ncbi:MAG: hypothetical protein HDR88_15995 [Bacteroides sp.]|nr:hypothetical protein [Bacteroides sp.]